MTLSRVALFSVVLAVLSNCTGCGTPTLSLKPKEARVAPGAQVQFSATVSGVDNTAVTWTVTESGGGSIDADGLYTAPGQTGSFHVTATLAANSTVTDTATVTVLANGTGIAVNVAPAMASVEVNKTQQFVASVATVGGQSDAVTWTVVEANGGTIDQNGLYRAPAMTGVFHVQAISSADSTAKGEATVTVTPAAVVTPVAVTINPATVTMGAGEMRTFTATVTNSTNTAVTWSITEGGAGGSVTAGGAYTAPTAPGTYHVVATSQADTMKKATATVTVVPVVVTVSPTPVLVEIGSTQTFTATVGGAANTQVTWAVTEGTTGGSVTSGGVYTPPSTPGTFHVVATSVADASKSATATVNVINPVTVSLAPSTANLTTQQQQQFTATVMGNTNQQVTWAVMEGAVGGSITATGLYTAPAVTSTQTFHVTATPQANPAKVATATVTVAPGVGVQITPSAVTLQPGAMQTFTASVTGTSNLGVTWSVQEAMGGTVTSTGAYTAPTASGTYHVVATSQADSSKRDIATVIVLGTPVTVSGTLTYTGAKTGKAYVILADSETAAGIAGTQVTFSGTTATYTLRGVQARGDFTVRAFIDTMDNGMYHLAKDPYGTVDITIANANFTNANITLTDSSWNQYLSTATPTIERVIPGDGAVALTYTPALSSGRDECPRYTVLWNTTSTVNNSNNIGSLTFNANAPHLVVVRGLTNGDTLYFSMTCPDAVLLGGYAPVKGPITVGATSGGATLNGSVDSSALTSLTNAPLYVFAVSSTGGYMTKVLAPTAQQNWSIAGLQPGTYAVYALRDASDDGKVTPIDPNTFFDPQTVVVNGNQTAAPLVLSGANAATKVTTWHVSDSGAESYGLRFVVRPNLKRPVKVALTAGPKLSLPIDLPLDENGGARHVITLPLGNIAPSESDAYTLAVTYSDATTENLTATVSKVLAVPVVTAPGATSSTMPTFTWQSLPNGSFAALRLYSWTYAGIGTLASLLGYADDVPSTRTTLLFSDLHASGPLSSSVLPYWYELYVFDANGNWAERIDSFVVQ